MWCHQVSRLKRLVFVCWFLGAHFSLWACHGVPWRPELYRGLNKYSYGETSFRNLSHHVPSTNLALDCCWPKEVPRIILTALSCCNYRGHHRSYDIVWFCLEVITFPLKMCLPLERLSFMSSRSHSTRHRCFGAMSSRSHSTSHRCFGAYRSTDCLSRRRELRLTKIYARSSRWERLSIMFHMLMY